MIELEEEPKTWTIILKSAMIVRLRVTSRCDCEWTLARRKFQNKILGKTTALSLSLDAHNVDAARNMAIGSIRRSAPSRNKRITRLRKATCTTRSNLDAQTITTQFYITPSNTAKSFFSTSPPKILSPALSFIKQPSASPTSFSTPSATPIHSSNVTISIPNFFPPSLTNA